MYKRNGILGNEFCAVMMSGSYAERVAENYCRKSEHPLRKGWEPQLQGTLCTPAGPLSLVVISYKTFNMRAQLEKRTYADNVMLFSTQNACRTLWCSGFWSWRRTIDENCRIFAVFFLA